jgi:hypothetical protein
MKSELVSQGSDICKTMPLPSPALYGFGFQLWFVPHIRPRRCGGCEKAGAALLYHKVAVF